MKITVEFDRDWYEMLRERILPRIRSSTIDTLEEEVAAAIVVCIDHGGDSIQQHRGQPPTQTTFPFENRFTPGRN